MPTYDYQCDACGHEFELFQGITEATKKKCPACKKMKLRRLFGTGAALMFKGSGFYETDYRSESYKKGAEADKKSTSETSSEGKSESKAATKPESKSEAKSDSNKNPPPKKDSGPKSDP